MADHRSWVGRVLGVAEVGHAQWFFGNLYEAVVRVPDLVAELPDPMSPLGRGSPVRYFAPAVPATFPALLAAAIAGRRDVRGRVWLVGAAACSLAGAGLTGYLVRKVNFPLFFGAATLTPQERDDLLRLWHRLNWVRLAAVGAAWVATRGARSRISTVDDRAVIHGRRHAANSQPTPAVRPMSNG